MWSTDGQVYQDAIKRNALNYIANYEHLEVVDYLDAHGGSILTAFMVKYSPSQVCNDLALKISELR